MPDSLVDHPIKSVFIRYELQCRQIFWRNIPVRILQPTPLRLVNLGIYRHSSSPFCTNTEMHLAATPTFYWSDAITASYSTHLLVVAIERIFVDPVKTTGIQHELRFRN